MRLVIDLGNEKSSAKVLSRGKLSMFQKEHYESLRARSSRLAGLGKDFRLILCD